jgi:hypothetical protein
MRFSATLSILFSLFVIISVAACASFLVIFHSERRSGNLIFGNIKIPWGKSAQWSVYFAALIFAAVYVNTHLPLSPLDIQPVDPKPKVLPAPPKPKRVHKPNAGKAGSENRRIVRHEFGRGCDPAASVRKKLRTKSPVH